MSKMKSKIEPNIKKIIIRFLSELSRYIHIDDAYLYGSYARGDYLKTSDIDLIIVSDDFKDMKFTERLDMIENIIWRMKLKPHIQAIPLTNEELRNGIKRSFLLIDASKYWIKISEIMRGRSIGRE